MTRRLGALTLDTLGDLPAPCRRCLAWELDEVAARRAAASGDPSFEKEAWLSEVLLEWGSCGRIAYVDDDPAGFVTYAPPGYSPRALGFPTSPVAQDATLLMVINGYHDLVGFTLPETPGGAGWELLADTNLPDGEAQPPFDFGAVYQATGRSVLLFLLRPEG